MEYAYEVDHERNMAIIRGRASHPLTRVKIYTVKVAESGTRTRAGLVKTADADTFGRFTAEIDQSGFEPNEALGEVELERVDLTAAARLNNFFADLLKNITAGSTIFAQTGRSAVLELNPILSYVEGYVYDPTGRVMPNAVVEIILDHTAKPYFTARADESGYIRISSSNLPQVAPFTLRYSQPAKRGVIPVTVTPAKFIADNLKLLGKEKLSLSRPKIVEASTGEDTASLPAAAAASPTLLIIGAVTLGVLGVVGLVFAFSLLRKRATAF